MVLLALLQLYCTSSYQYAWRCFWMTQALQHADRSRLSVEEKGAWMTRLLLKHSLGYAQEMANRPQTLYGLEDYCQARAWMLDHDCCSLALIARVFAGQSDA